jgi:hypothetical protein
LCGPEACWNILGHECAVVSPSVVRLYAHLDGEQFVFLDDETAADPDLLQQFLENPKETMLLKYFDLCRTGSSADQAEAGLCRDIASRLLFHQLPGQSFASIFLKLLRLAVSSLKLQPTTPIKPLSGVRAPCCSTYHIPPHVQLTAYPSDCSPHLGYFTWNAKKRVWQRRQRYEGTVDSPDPHKKSSSIGRLCSVSPAQGELFSLHRLLLNTPGAQSYEHIRTFEDATGDPVVAATFREACVQRGLMDSNEEMARVMSLAVEELSPSQARSTLCDLLIWATNIEDPAALWVQFQDRLSDDFEFRARAHILDDDRRLQLARSCALADLHSSLEERNAKVADDGSCLGLPAPSLTDVATYTSETGSLPPRRSFLDDGRQMSVGDRQTLADRAAAQRATMTTAQADVYDTVLAAVNDSTPGRPKGFLLACSAGSGKTFVTKAIAAVVRSNSKLCLTMAASGVAAALQDEASTFHSACGATVNEPTEDMEFPVTRASIRGARLCAADLIIIDEARFTFAL